MSQAYESNQYTLPPGFANPTSASAIGGAQQAASQSVVGEDALVTASLPYQGIGLAQVPAGVTAFTPFDGDIP